MAEHAPIEAPASPAGGAPGGRGGAGSAAISLGLIAAILIVANVIISTWPLRWDLTESGRYTVGAPTRRIVERLDRIVTVKVYLSRDLPARLLARDRAFRDVLAELDAIGKSELKIEVIDPSGDEDLQTELRRIGVAPGNVTIIDDEEKRQVQVWMSAVVHCEDRREVVPLVLASANVEYDLALGIRRASLRAPPRVAFTSGHGEPTSAGFVSPAEKARGRGHLTEVLRRFYRVVELDTRTLRAVPDDVDVLVVIGPPNAFAESELYVLDQFVMRGGALVVLTDSFDIAKDGQPVRDPGLHEMLATWGVLVEPFVVADPLCDRVEVTVNQGRTAAIPYPYIVRVTAQGLHRTHPIVRGLAELRFLFPASLRLPGAWAKRAGEGEGDAGGSSRPVDEAGHGEAPVYHELVHTSESAWINSPPFVLHPTQVKQPKNPAVIGQRLLAAAVTGTLKSHFADRPIPELPATSRGGADVLENRRDSGPGGRVVVIANAEVVRDEFPIPPKDTPRPVVDNLRLVLNAIDWLAAEDLIDLRPPSPIRPISPQRSTSGARALAYAVNLVLIPLLVAFIGIARATIRRRAARREAAAFEATHDTEGETAPEATAADGGDAAAAAAPEDEAP